MRSTGSLTAFLLATLLAISLPAATAGKAPLKPLVAKPTAPAFSLADTEGGKLSLSQLRGKVVLLNFWATWCPPCREEMPSMQTLWQQLEGDHFELVAINVGEDDDLVFAFSNELEEPLTFPIVLDTDSKVVRSYPVIGLPTSFIVDKQGRMVYQTTGSRDWTSAEVLEVLQGLMAE